MPFDIYCIYGNEKNSFHSHSLCSPFVVLNNHFGLAFLLYCVIRFDKSRCMGTQPPWHFFQKITTTPSTSFSMVFLLFTKNFLACHSIFTVFIVTKKNHYIHILFVRFLFLFCIIVLDWRSCCIASFVSINHVAWGRNHLGNFF